MTFKGRHFFLGTEKELLVQEVASSLKNRQEITLTGRNFHPRPDKEILEQKATTP